tara:strand:+ start:697 stop:1017 length:321 start_codon:yes stop_codon:yes gene_type:complete
MNKTELEYIELANDCKNRIDNKNKEIKNLKNEIKQMKMTLKIMNRNVLKANYLLDIHSKYNILDDLNQLLKDIDLDYYFMDDDNESSDSESDTDILTNQLIDELDI